MQQIPLGQPSICAMFAGKNSTRRERQLERSWRLSRQFKCGCINHMPVVTIVYYYKDAESYACWNRRSIFGRTAMILRQAVLLGS